MRPLRVARALLAASVLFLGLGALRAQETPSEAPKKVEAPKKKRPRLEDCLGRAVARAKETGLTMARLTVAPDDASLVCIVEFATGDLAIYTGDEDPKQDAWVQLEQRNVALLKESVRRLQPDGATTLWGR